MTKVEVQKFKGDFNLAVAQLEEKYGVNISLGTIRFGVDGLSAKMKAIKGEKVIRATKNDFQVGDTVSIDHKTMNPNDEFEIIKINAKNIKVRGKGGHVFNVSPSLLIKQ